MNHSWAAPSRGLIGAGGPFQIEARINQNTEISQQLSLWNQMGSRVIRGNLLVIPIENSILYVSPLYLQDNCLGAVAPPLRLVWRIVLRRASPKVEQNQRCCGVAPRRGAGVNTAGRERAPFLTWEIRRRHRVCLTL
jgi:hypothetical protein